MSKMNGTPGNDRLIGGSHHDVLTGEDGADVLRGGEGNDRLFGGSGDDRIEGGTGIDRLTGGLGADRFIYTKPSDSTSFQTDTIRDFQQGEDKVLFRDEFLSGAPLHFIGPDAFSGTPGEVRFMIGGGRTNVQVDLNGDGGIDTIIVFDQEIHFHRSDFSF